MTSCTFFGHRECPESIKPKLKSCLTELIERDGVNTFYVGNQGQFDALVCTVLKELREQYPCISFTVVPAYMPQDRIAEGLYPDTLFPAVLETTPKRYAVDRRNRWMLEHADVVVSYIAHSWGGAAKFADMARQQGKRVVNLFQEKPCPCKARA